jgi:hypothetical protein
MPWKSGKGVRMMLHHPNFHSLMLTITPEKAYGVSILNLRKLAKRIDNEEKYD